MALADSIMVNGIRYNLLTTEGTRDAANHWKKGHGPGYWRYQTVPYPVSVGGKRRNFYAVYGYRDTEYEKKQTAKLRQTGYLKTEPHTGSKQKQVGTSNTTRDKARKAKPPGRRTSSSGKIYFENRKNRSDLFGWV